jgi:hypothetical protein
VGEGGGFALMGLEGGASSTSTLRFEPKVKELYEGNERPSSSSESFSSNLVFSDRLLDGVEENEDVCEELREPDRRFGCE